MHAPGCSLSTTARLLLYELAAHCGEDGTCSPSVARLADGLGVHAGNVRRARAELVAAGLVAVEIQRGRGHANVYRFPFVAHPSANGDRPPERRNGKPRTSARLSNPQTAQEHAVSPSTNRAAVRGTYPQIAQRNPQTAQQRAENRAPVRAKVGREVVSREVARSRRRTNGARDPLSALVANGINPFTGKQTAAKR